MVRLSWDGIVRPRRKPERHKVNDAWCLIQSTPFGEYQKLCVLREYGVIERALGQLIRKWMKKVYALLESMHLGGYALRESCL